MLTRTTSPNSQYQGASVLGRAAGMRSNLQEGGTHGGGINPHSQLGDYIKQDWLFWEGSVSSLGETSPARTAMQLKFRRFGFRLLSCWHCSPASPFPASLSASGRGRRVVLPTLGLAFPLHPWSCKGHRCYCIKRHAFGGGCCQSICTASPIRLDNLSIVP